LKEPKMIQLQAIKDLIGTVENLRTKVVKQYDEEKLHLDEETYITFSLRGKYDAYTNVLGLLNTINKGREI